MNVENIEFDQSQMRSDLLKCFINRRLQPFPILETFTCRTQLLFPHREIAIFCHCLMPETYADMVECDRCNKWFHISCVGIKIPPTEAEQWCRSSLLLLCI